ncbi:MAG TPA: hypothetical protein DD490_15115 [Acidobacteria bacterium]|nr:hypothetical protein [Acidobacteriota bacterium]
MMDPEAEVEAVRAALRGLVRLNDRGFAWVDRQLGWSEATASQILRGRIKLQVMHVFQILMLFKVEPEDFFGSLYGKPVEAAGRMMERRREPAEAAQVRPASGTRRSKETTRN